MQRGIVPATRGFESPNDMIDRGLPLSIAGSPTVLKRDDLLSVSASGWGGVNSHVILAFPDERLQKQATISLAAGTWNRKTLAAPRLQVVPATEPATLVTPSTRISLPKTAHPSPTHPASFDATDTYVQSASTILGVQDIKPDTDLRKEGMDSMAYVSIVSMTADKLGRPSLGTKGLRLPVCSPAALAKLHDEQAKADTT